MIEDIKLGISPLLWSNDDFTDIGQDITLSQCLTDMSFLMYEGCEIGSKFPSDIENLESLSNEYKLKFCNQWFSLHLLTIPFEVVKYEFEKHLTKLAKLGAKVVGVAEVSFSTHGQLDKCPFISKPSLKNKKEWEIFVDKLNQLGQLAQTYEISLCYHHHLGTVVHTAYEIDLLMDHSDPSYVFLNYDTGHLLMAGEDPYDVWERHHQRVRHIHLKNVVNNKLKRAISEEWSFKKAIIEGIFTVPGDVVGMLNTSKIMDMIMATNYKGWIIIEAELNPQKINAVERARLAKHTIEQWLPTRRTDIDYLCIGHACHDVVDGGYALGGTVSYASTLASTFGKKVAVLTSFGDDFQFKGSFLKEDIQLFIKRSERTTVFENVYTNQKRIQYLRSTADKILIADVPSNLHAVEVVHFGLIADEIDLGLIQLFPNSLKVATIQGLLRKWDNSGLVSAKSIDWSLLKGLDIIIYSDEDVSGIPDPTEYLIKYIPIVIETRGSEGVIVYSAGETSRHPVYPTKEVDPTGAGDVFSTAFIIKYIETKDLKLSVAFGQCASSLIIERHGTHPIPTIFEIEERLKLYGAL